MPTYCSATDVSGFLQVAAFGAGTKPTLTQVNDMIDRKEQFIDTFTHHSFKTTTITNEYRDFPRERFSYRYGWDGFRVFLDHRQIRLTAGLKLDTGAGDKLEIFDGATFIDWTSTRTDGRGDDFWVEPELGILWIRTISHYPKASSIRITYRYGSSTVPDDIKDACMLLVSADIISNEDRSILMPDVGTSQVPYDNRSSQWKREAREILNLRTEIVIGR